MLCSQICRMDAAKVYIQNLDPSNHHEWTTTLVHSTSVVSTDQTMLLDLFSTGNHLETQVSIEISKI